MQRVDFSDELSRIDFDFVHQYLSQSYWSEGISVERMKRAIKNSINVGAFVEGEQVGYARIVTDSATFAYLCDVFVCNEYQGRGYGKAMIDYVLALPQLYGIKRFNLTTRDAHKLYESFGWQALGDQSVHMEIYKPGIYKKLGE